MQVFELKPHQIIGLFEPLHQYGSQLAQISYGSSITVGSELLNQPGTLCIAYLQSRHSYTYQIGYRGNYFFGINGQGNPSYVSSLMLI